ncbi:COX15/CtaA family protein [uncultured Rhodospira sp.]|uniref:COX15/CtaA family protein n=1 Tax=uncultured Rhodospira sp. TaxID=1936189 RepID=UPI0026235749|nr:COX15/CtaA family protein [uncultured Rhodospira sp.]
MTAATTLAQSDSARAQNKARPRAVAAWLLACAGLVAGTVLLGGLTRLTGSGLSIVEWKPVTGVLPPLSQADWQALFLKYQQTPEFRLVNSAMTLDGFKGIFWLEYLHRLLGRLIGVAFLLPLVWFAVRGAIPQGYGWRLAALFVLGGLQGLLGWLMVQSGLVDRPQVSHLRLAAHLGLAVVILAALVWVALDLLRGPGTPALAGHPRVAVTRRLGWGALALTGLTILAGALVAGLDAGLSFNTFPRMAGQWVPDGLLHLDPWWRNLLDNVITVQWQHRLLGGATLAAVLVVSWHGLRTPLDGADRWPFRLLPVAVLAQVGLGVATLLLAVPMPLAVAHQAGAVAVVGLLVWAVHVTSAPAR